MDLNVESPFFLTWMLHGLLKARASYEASKAPPNLPDPSGWRRG